MKTLAYPRSQQNITTMTVGELIEKLRTYPPEMPVTTTWEGVSTPVQEEAFNTEHFFRDLSDLSVKVKTLVIDVDQV